MKRLLLFPVLSLSLSASILSDTNFINKVYEDLLNRPVDPVGLSTLLSYLATPGNTGQGMALAILASPEYRTDLVGNYYNAYLHRPADSGASGLVAALGSGATDESVQSIIVGSLEYFADHGSDNTLFIDALFPDLLNRPASPLDVSTGLAILASNTRAQFAGVLLSSSEYDNLLVKNYYQAYLNRAADPFGLSSFVGQLQASVTNEVVQSEIIGSQEYYTLAQAPEPVSFAQGGIGVALLWLCTRRRRPPQA